MRRPTSTASTWPPACSTRETSSSCTRSERTSRWQLSDFEPKGAACAAFGVLHEGGFPQRALVAIDRDGVVRWSFQAPSPAELPPVELLREGVAALPADRPAG